MKKLAIAAALAASLVATGPAFAAETFVVRIDYGDLDLTTSAGVQQLGQRIEAKAVEACGSPFIRDLKGVAAFEQCKERVVSGAVAQLDAKGVGLTRID